MIPMNHPVMAVLQAMRQGQNPQAVLGRMARQDPRIAQSMQMMQGKNGAQLRAMAENMAKERGTSVEDVARQLGLTIPSNR